jgi:hypothetical protein
MVTSARLSALVSTVRTPYLVVSIPSKELQPFARLKVEQENHKLQHLDGELHDRKGSC